MTAPEVLEQLAQMGSESTKKTLMKHGAKEPFFGVKVGDMKKIQKKVKKDHELSLALYDTGNSDAMYLAGLIADEDKITKEDLQNWVEKAYWSQLSEYTVAWVAAESRFGYELACEWIDSDDESIASAGWATLGSLVGIKQDDDLPVDELRQLLERVRKEIHQAQNRVRYTMNGFVIAAGSSVAALTELAIEIGAENGKVHVEMGGTACKVPFAVDYIEKVKGAGRIGKKRKMARC